MSEFLNARNPIQKISEEEIFGQSGKNGGRLACNTYYYTKDGIPVFPIAGEAHPARIDPRFWEETILRMKAGGLNTVSFYIFWIFVEPRPGVFNFTGRNNIRRFLQLCAKHGMAAIPRIGPFCNAEIAHGGLPSWLYGMPVSERSNDEGYFALVRRLYEHLAEQFRGLTYREGGPIVAIQIENEYGHAPALWSCFYPFGGRELVNTGNGGAEHLRRLKIIAREAGMDVPFYTVTAWGNAPCPEGEFIPVSGAYTYLSSGGPTAASTFNGEPHSYQTPFSTCELGTGGNVQKDWRPHVPPQAAVVPFFNSLAQGSNAAGFYMYAGGVNPPSRERFYVSDPKYLCMSLLSYDFSAPIGEYGLTNETYRHLRPWLLFARDFAPHLTRTKPVWAETYVGPEDTEHLRVMARVDGDSGYVFINNYQDKLSLPERENISVAVSLPGGEIRLPAQGGITVAADEMLALPFRFPMGGVILESAVAIPLCRLNEKTYVFRKTEKNDAVYVFSSDCHIRGAVPQKQKGFLSVTARAGTAFTVDDITVLTLDATDARNALKITVPTAKTNEEMLLCSREDFIYQNGKVTFTSFSPSFSYTLWRDGYSRTYAAQAESRKPEAEIRVLNGEWATVNADRSIFSGLDDVFLNLTFRGDMARVFADGELVADHYHDGRPWLVSLRHLQKEVTSPAGVAIRLLPRADGKTAMFFDGITFRPVSEGGASETAFLSLTLLPRYRKTVDLRAVIKH